MKFGKNEKLSDNQGRKPTAMESNNNPFDEANYAKYSINSIADSEACEDNFLQKIGFEADAIKKSKEGSLRPKPSFKLPEPKKIKSNKVSI